MIDLGHQPPSNAYLTAEQLAGPEITYPLRLLVCGSCWLVQLPAHAAAEGPCDITGAAGNPCVAAHSTTRALYAAYDVSCWRHAEIATNKTFRQIKSVVSRGRGRSTT